MKQIQIIAYAVFLVAYAVQKYMAQPELMGNFSYIWTTALLVLLTAIIPFVVPRAFLPKLADTGAYLIAGLLPLILAGVGLTLYFYAFINGNAPGITISDVLPRALTPGIVIGLILIIPILIARRKGGDADERGDSARNGE